jgi:photosystem II stability/assembly factor-like uncharacterized protein
MKPIYITLLIISIGMLVHFSIMAQLPKGWEIVDRRESIYQENYLKIGCPDSMNCMIWIDLSVNGFDGQAFRRSTDGGQTWKTVFEEAGYEKKNGDWVILPTVNMISYPNEKLFIAAGDSGLIIRTTDRGETWKKSFLDKDLHLSRLYMLDEKYGMIVACPYDDLICKIMFTYDGGISWVEKEIPGNMGFYEFDIINRNLIYSPISIQGLKRRRFLLKIHDDWASWDTLQLPKDVFTANLDFINEKEGWIAGGYKSDTCSITTQQIYYTSDGGETWIKQRDTHRTCRVISDIKMYDNKFGIGQSCAALVVLTSDGGNTWEENFLEDVDPETTYFNCITSVQAPTANTAFACYDGSTIYKYTGPPVDVEEPRGDASGGIRLSPNPAGEYIEIRVPESLRVNPTDGKEGEIKIYNTMGECVMNYELRITNYEKERIDVSGLPPGMYYMSVNNGKEMLYGSFIVIR